MAKSAYIHIPFCKSKCKYCSFVSYIREDIVEDYIMALLKDINFNQCNNSLKTLYFGGGTPSLLPIKFLEKLISSFSYEKDYELTLEINPDDADLIYFKNLKSLGVNRLSIGSQTFNNQILELIGRRHNSNDIIKAVYLAKEAGFNNISLDLIYGLPTQDIKCLEEDLENFLKLDIQHISTYGLKIDENCFWEKFYDPKTRLLNYEGHKHLLVPDDDIQADMYELINNVLESKDFQRYEVSNFAKKGFESRHNLNYWNNAEYYGYGAAAHGYINGIRFANFIKLDDYINNPTKHCFEKVLTKKEMLEEEIFLGFRKREGININNINNKYGIDFENQFHSILEKYSGFFIKTQNGYTLTLHGVLISNLILSEFI